MANSGTDGNKQATHLASSKVYEFLKDMVALLPPKLRPIAILPIIFVILYILLRAWGGEHAVNGMVFTTAHETGRKGYTALVHHTLGHDGRYYTTDDKGTYYMSLSSIDLLASYFGGASNIDLALYTERDGTLFCKSSVESPLKARMRKIVVEADCKEGATTASSQSIPGWRPNLISSSYAQSEQPACTRLNIEAIKLSRRPASDTIYVDIPPTDTTRLTANRKLDSKQQGIPVIPGEWTEYRDQYYLRTAQRESGEIQFPIQYEQGWLNKTTEHFTVNSKDMVEKKSFKAIGSSGSEIILSAVPCYDLIVFSKPELYAQKEVVDQKLKSSLWTPIWKASPLGASYEANAVFSGKDVSFRAIQELLAKLSQVGFTPRSIQYGLDLKSGNPNEIQIGHSSSAAAKRPLTAQQIQAIVTAPDERSFKALVDTTP
jgi:hypothetical protein